MKKLFALAVLAFTLNTAFAQSNLPNGDFETWYTVPVNDSLSYDDIGAGPTDNWMATLNSLAAVPAIAGGPGPVTVFKTTDKYSGTYAAKAVSANFPLGWMTVFIPGMIGTATMDFPNVRAILGKPCPDCKPLRFSGYYKYEPVSGDSCAAIILLSKWNPTYHKRDTIGYGRMVQHSRVSEYTRFDIPVTYTGTETVDTMTLLILPSAGFNIYSFTQCQGQPGSTMYVDGLSLEYGAGIQQNLMPEIRVNAYPNPASDMLTVELSKELKNGSIEIYNTEGKPAGSYPISGVSGKCRVSQLANGVYYFRLMSGNQILNTGSFVVAK